MSKSQRREGLPTWAEIASANVLLGMTPQTALASARPAYEDEDLLIAADAAAIANRSVRTIRRAYRAGTLPAYRDAHGRGVRIRYRDLRDWMMSELLAPKVDRLALDGEPAPGLIFGVRPIPSGSRSENLALLNAARRARARRGLGGAAGRRAAARPVSPQV
jgi:excisionase family DNA binding protein